MNRLGISEKSYRLLVDTLSEYPQIEQVLIFGSRANGNYKKGSDIDLAIIGVDCSAKLALNLKGYINEELPIPYMVDIVDYHSLKTKELKEHIDRVGIQFHKK